jgi:hypothetical protein
VKGASIRAVVDTSLIPMFVFDNKALTSGDHTRSS